MYSGRALMATITATFHANLTEITKERSGVASQHGVRDTPRRQLTKVLGQENDTNSIEEERDDLRDNHVHVPMKRRKQGKDQGEYSVAYHVVISRATMMSSLRIRAVNEMDTILRNWFSKRTRDMIMIAPPAEEGNQV
jgi:hypothetical protein